MSLVVGESIRKSWSEKDVLRNVSFTLSPDERVGLVGPNGHGKTTLIRMIAALEAPTEGTIQRKTNLRIGYLPQDPPALEGSSLHQAMLDVFGDLFAVERELGEIAHQMEQHGGDERLMARYGELQHRFEDRGGYTYNNRIEQVLSGLGFDREAWDRPLSQLSGGQRTRAYLAKLLLEDPEVLLLDEPTNHLDLAAVEWLEKWIDDFHGALIVVSHDRYFLDRVTTKTWEVAFASLEAYTGSYTHYLQQRNERFKERMRRWEAQQLYIEETEEFVRRFLAGQRSKEAQGRRTRLERFMRTEAIEKPRQHSRIAVRLRAPSRTGDFVLYLRELAAGYQAGRPLVAVEKLEVQRGQRIAIVGPNGCGKTTLLRTMLNKLPALGGTARWGAGVRLAYLSQTHTELATHSTALEALRNIEPSLTEERARSLLGSLLLSGDDAFKRISELSGGQRSRVVLARLMLQNGNVLILDEPTNHLDIASQEVLQDVLSEFDGTILFVSHDRYLIRALATHIWAIEDGAVHPLAGDWETYVKWRAERAGQELPHVAQAQAQREKLVRKEDHAQRRKRTNELQKLQRRLADVEAEIHKLEADIKATLDGINEAGLAGKVDDVARLGTHYEQCNVRLQSLMHDWEQASLALEEES